MSAGIYSEIEQLSELKGIDAGIVMEAVKDAMLVAARKYYKSTEDLVAELNTKTGGIDVFAVKTVTDLVADPTKEVSLAQARKIDSKAVIGGEIRFAMPTAPLGRISAQMAKQVIFQKIREAERDTVCAEFEDRIGTMESCTIKRTEGPDLIVELGRTEARLPRREQSRLESFSIGDRVRVAIKMIEKAGRGPAVIVSRASEDLVRRLFEQEVPEIYDNTVEIMACAREAGERTKIAVKSHDRDVDAVGACVGMKGMRVQTIIRELRGEKIDIIEFTESTTDLAHRALSPARISRVVLLDPVEKHLEVIVDEMQLSLAIGKKGQNVRLAAKLLGWRIDIKSEDEKRIEVEEAMGAMSGGGTPVSVLIEYGLSEGLVDRLIESGGATVEALADMTPEQLQSMPGIGAELVEKIQLGVNGYYSHFEKTVGARAAEAEEAEAAAKAQKDEALDSVEAEESAPAVPVVLPGVPEAGAGTAEEDDDETVEFDEGELQRFDKMNMPVQTVEEPASSEASVEADASTAVIDATESATIVESETVNDEDVGKLSGEDKSLTASE